MNYILLAVILAFMTILSFSEKSIAVKTEKTAIFGGGCFWCMEPPFEQLEGVIEVIAGYTGGTKEDAQYRLVSKGITDHLEAVRIHYDPEKISYEKLVDTFWRQINPTDAGGQFADRGNHYRTAIFYTTDEQRITAERSKKELDESKLFDLPVVTAIVPAKPFYKAEEYHQDYYLKNVLHYSSYKEGSGRKSYIEKVWGDQVNDSGVFVKPNDKTLKEKLTTLQYEVTQKDGTEPPFKNEYWDNNAEGIYVDVVSGEALFSSRDKFKSGTGWPSFTRPLEEENVIEKRDISHFLLRTEVRSRQGDSHLGHVFNDGPPPTKLRYCINSAALKFVPVDELESEGYSRYMDLFK